MFFVCDGETKADVNTCDLFHEVLGETREGGFPSLWRAGGLSMTGRKRWGQKYCSTILRAITRRAMIAPQQTIMCLNSS